VIMAELEVRERRKSKNEDAIEDKTSREEGIANGSRPPSTDASNNANTQEDKPDNKETSTLKKIYAKLGLDVGTLMMMFKGSVAPTIAIAFYQADSVCSVP